MPTNVPPSGEGEGSLMALLVNVSKVWGARALKRVWYLLKRVSGGTVFPHCLNPSSFLRTYILETRREEAERKEEPESCDTSLGKREGYATIGIRRRTNERVNNTILNFGRGKEPEQKS